METVLIEPTISLPGVEDETTKACITTTLEPKWAGCMLMICSSHVRGVVWNVVGLELEPLS